MLHPLIRKLESFTHFSQDDRAAVERSASRAIREVPPRRDLIREGEVPRGMFLILEGWGCRYKTLPDGRRQIVAFFLPGDICDLNLHILGKMDHSVAAITRMKVAEIGPDDFDELLTDYPRIAQALKWHDLVDGSIQREWALNLGQRAAFERISHLLCETFLRLESVGLTNGRSCDFPLTQLDLAEATGLTSVHVNRTLQELRRCGLIELQSRKLIIPDLEALKEAGLFNANYLHLDSAGRHLDANDLPVGG